MHMNNQTTKKGFSLVEVMILFTVLAVAMAATLPVVTNKSKAVPTSTSTGVYRCIAIGNGKFLEERWGSTKATKPPQQVASCSFKPPKASVYKIDIYSAGAGGTKYAAYYAEQDDNRNASFTMSDAENYARNGSNNTLPFSEVSGKTEMPYEITDEDIRKAIKDIHIKQTAFTGNGGNGGNVTYYYSSPKYAKCTENDAKIPIYENADLYQIDTNRNVEHQFTDFCKQYDPYGLSTFTPNSNIVGYGSSGGKGQYIELDYQLNYGDYERARYTAGSENFPFVRYIGELYGNVANRGYEFNKCSSLTMNSFTCSPGTISDAANGKSVDNSKSSSLTLRNNGNKKYYYLAEDGKDIGDKYVGIHVPSHTDLTRPGEYKTIQTGSATGGKGGSAGYEAVGPIYISSDPNRYKTNYGWKVYADPKPANGTDATVDPAIHTAGRWTISQSSSNNAQEPKIRLQAKLWTKKYNVGRPGTAGKHVHVQTSTLGTSCRISVPQGGPTFDYVALVQEANTTEPELSKFLNKKAQAYEKKLNAEVVCTDNDNNKVFNKTVEGGKYNINLTGWTQPFYWSRGKDPTTDPHVVQVEYKGDPQYNGITSKWAKIFNKMDPLTTWHISAAGTGTSITDRCVRPRGTYDFNTYSLNSYGDGSWYETLLYGADQSINKTYDGKLNGYQCYSVDESTKNQDGSGARDLNNITPEDAQYYNIQAPTAAGGGAVVISW